jgi:hypothetical protein
MNYLNAFFILFYLIQFGCTNAKVNVTGISSTFDGVWLLNSEAKVSSINSFTIKGGCSTKVLRIYFKIDSNSPWNQIDGTNGTVSCSNDGQFTINFSETTEKINSSSGYVKSSGQANAQLKILIYGESEFYDSVVKTFTAFIEPSGKKSNGLSATGTHELAGFGFKIKGHLVNSNIGSGLSTATQKVSPLSKELIK